MKWKKIIGVLGILALASFFLTACGSKSDSKSELKVGVMTLDDATKPVWDKVKENAAKKGVTIKFVQFSDYNQPNKALAAGDIDVNAYQTNVFLDDWNEKNKENLVSVGDTLISPIRLFSVTTSKGKAKYSDVKDLPDGAKIALDNDATNKSRALFVLQSAGLIELSTKEGELATTKDITKNSKNLDIKEVGAEQVAKVLQNGDVDAAVINNSYAQTSKIDYKTTLYKEDVSGEEAKDFINVIAAQSDWKKSEKADAIKTLVDVYQTDEIGKLISKSSNGVDQPIWKGAPDTTSDK
ncbi:MetQ/NlpA family ABC transporter substrate-binding protein [Streptococcus dentapri]|uniref:MetQ/NlpA family ABC transporter substrate-binding protein n=1 Tax=Streptococcus dentapri TaxID=573564 RepID=A0ABV8D129_9STRE